MSDNNKRTSSVQEVVQERTRETNRDNELRKERVPRHEQNGLTLFNLDDSFRYRWVNDVYGRIDSFISAGWVIAEGDLTNTSSGKGREIETQSSSQLWRTVNKRDGQRAVLMKIKKEWFDEDQATKLEIVNEREKHIDPDGVIRNAQLRGALGNLNKQKSNK